MTDQPRFGVALVGCGEISRPPVRPLGGVDDAQLRAVVDRDERRSRALAAELGGVPAFTDVHRMLAEVHPDVVHVLTPPDSHAPVAMAAMEAGAHALVEKPMALRTSDAEAMIGCAKRTGRVLGTCHNMLFTPGVQRARRLVADGAIGDVVHVATYWGMAPDKGAYAGAPGTHWAWRMRGGIFTNFLPHTISLLREFLGEDMETHDVVVTNRSDKPTTGTDILVVVAGPQRWGTMTVSMSDRPAMRFVDVYGTRGLLHVDLARETCVVLPQRRVPGMVGKVMFGFGRAWQTGAGTVKSTVMAASGRWRGNPGMTPLVGEFYAALRDRRTPPVTGADGHAVVDVMEQIWHRAGSALEPDASAVRDAPRSAVESLLAEDLAGRRVLVTGAGGFLGARLVGALHRCGADVAVIVRDRRRLAFDVEAVADVFAGDLHDAHVLKDAMHDADIVVHCAAATANAAGWDQHERDTVAATAAVCEAAASAHVDRLIHVSSVVVYGMASGLDGSMVDERMPVAPVTDPLAHYQRAKAEAERVALGFATDHHLPVVVLRPGILHGPGRPIRGGLVQLGRWWVGIGSRRNTLPFTHVDNTVDAILLAATVDAAPGGVFNIVDEPQRSIADLLRSAATGDRPRFVAVPVWVAHALASYAERRAAQKGRSRAPRLSHFAVRSATRDIRYDTAAAVRVLGWRGQRQVETRVGPEEKPGAVKEETP